MIFHCEVHVSTEHDKENGCLACEHDGALDEAHMAELKAAREMREQMAVLRIHGIRFGKTAVGKSIDAYDTARKRSEELEGGDAG